MGACDRGAGSRRARCASRASRGDHEATREAVEVEGVVEPRQRLRGRRPAGDEAELSARRLGGPGEKREDRLQLGVARGRE